MLYKEYTIKLIQTSKLDDYQRKFVRLSSVSSYFNQEKAILYPWIAAVSLLRVFYTKNYHPGLRWCSDFAVGAQTPKDALHLAKCQIDDDEALCFAKYKADDTVQKNQFEIF